jgi:type II secretory pathway component PulF
MSDLGPSVADIAQARNQKLQHEAEARGQQTQLEVEADTAQEVAEELKAAHLAALHIKDILPEPIQDTTQTQVRTAAAAAASSLLLWQ